jgi:CheY-like chemotaxis protein
MKVLIVEDDHANAFVARVYLEEFGFECDIAESGAMALALIGAKKYDAILMDIGMRGLDGYETTRAIRLHERRNARAATAIIGVTGYAFNSDREKCFEAGMDDYLSKPYRPVELRAKLTSLHENKHPTTAHHA